MKEDKDSQVNIRVSKKVAGGGAAGAVLGAVVAGPVGAVVGGTVGALVGKAVEKNSGLSVRPVKKGHAGSVASQKAQGKRMPSKSRSSRPSQRTRSKKVRR